MPLHACRSPRSIFGLPLLSPLHQVYSLWANWILLLDCTYTALLVPVLVGYKVSDVNFSWGCYIDLIAGSGSLLQMACMAGTAWPLLPFQKCVCVWGGGGTGHTVNPECASDEGSSMQCSLVLKGAWRLPHLPASLHPDPCVHASLCWLQLPVLWVLGRCVLCSGAVPGLSHGVCGHL